ncbi:L domain-like protein [Anaeromyces robustus]|uniref:L domain-like protein n=1 Tax=Anaeromyces robustus TaxID=1754192 RepID=A0A1Y1W6E8_9FUNG|nr:L domain-like protein [Anaeromyces robustus]|eukprot:ORX68908.1 L domain-like protein [Anaeromyces robustus]
MKFTSLKNILCFITFFNIALVKAENDCKKIQDIIDKSSYLSKCEENENGKVINLSIDFCDELKPENVDKVLSFNTIETLSYHNRVIKNDAISFEKLTNLKELTFANYEYSEFGYRDYYSFIVDRGQFAKNGIKLPKSLKKLSFVGLEFNQDAIDEITTLTNLEEIEFKYCILDKLNLEALSKLEKLTTLTVTDNQADDYEGYLSDNVLKHFKYLNKLTLDAVNLNNEHIKEISILTNLKELNLVNTAQDKLNYESFKNLSNLTTLNIDTKAYIQYNEDILKYVKNLKKLKLDNIHKITPVLIKDINGLTELEELSIIPLLKYEEYKKNVQPFDITSLDNLKNLKSLVLDGDNIYYNGKFDLSLFKNLRRLYINHGVYQEHIDQMTTLKNLEELYLYNVNFKDLKLDALKNLNNLTVLEIKCWIVDLVELKEIPKFVYELPNLKKLVIQESLEGPIPTELTKNKKLEYISFMNNDFKSIPVELASLPNLKYINLYYNEQITKVPKELNDIVHFDEKDAEYTLISNLNDDNNVDEIEPIITTIYDESITTTFVDEPLITTAVDDDDDNDEEEKSKTTITITKTKVITATITSTTSAIDIEEEPTSITIVVDDNGDDAQLAYSTIVEFKTISVDDDDVDDDDVDDDDVDDDDNNEDSAIEVDDDDNEATPIDDDNDDDNEAIPVDDDDDDDDNDNDDNDNEDSTVEVDDDDNEATPVDDDNKDLAIEVEADVDKEDEEETTSLSDKEDSEVEEEKKKEEKPVVTIKSTVTAPVPFATKAIKKLVVLPTNMPTEKRRKCVVKKHTN